MIHSRIEPIQRAWRAIACSAACVAGLLPAAVLAQAASDSRTYEQRPEIVAAQSKDGTTTPVAAPADVSAKLNAGPAPSWIWGPEANRRYFLKTTFTGGAQHARLRTTADNHVKIWINGKEVAATDDWHAPAEVDIQKHLLPGENTILADIKNDDGPSGFLFKLVLVRDDGKADYVVSDDTWKAAESKDAADWLTVKVNAKYGSGPWGDAFSNQPVAGGTPRGVFEVLPGFQVERLFTVPKEELGSWVCLTVDPKGRIIASDQGDKGLVRITPPAIGSQDATKVEKLDVKMTGAQGMLFAFDSLYVSANGGPGSGLYRLRDTNGDDQFDEVTKLAAFQGGGEHGPHSLRLSPDGKSIVVICGNHTRTPPTITSLIPKNWSEDLLLPRQWDANGHAAGILAPGGWIAETDPEGKTWKIVSMGYRNPYDFDYNADGEMFAYDADMEWDMGTPWYRPTRVVHATSGSEFGWRSGTGKWPAYYVDSLPELVDIGPGSPVGVTFGYGAKFPAKYQQALYILDWTFGTIYALHLTPDGSSYRAEKEEFVARTPLPLTDAVIGKDGAMYFAVGGRGTQSELFRVTYVGQASTAPAELRDQAGADLRDLRHKLERFHRLAAEGDAASQTLAATAEAVKYIWPYLNHPDRFIRYAARIALEQQPVAAWQDKVFTEKNPQARIIAAVALARQGEPAVEPKLIEALSAIDAASLDEAWQLDLFRAWQLVFVRLGEPSPEVAAKVASQLDRFYPAKSKPLNRELVILLVYLKSPSVVAKSIALLQAPSVVDADQMAQLLARNPGYGGAIKQMLANQPDIEKLHIAFALRNMKEGWKPAERMAYFNWIKEAKTKTGGNSYQGFLRNMDRDAFANATDAERLAIEASGARQPFRAPELPKATGPGKDWKMPELLALAETKFKGRNFENGKKMFAAARCVVCHRFTEEGGATGPDLTQAAGRFSFKDMGEAIVEPSKVVSDQYKGTQVTTVEGKVYAGRVVSETADATTILTDPEDSTKIVTIKKADIEEVLPLKLSLMPEGLLKQLNEDEVLDLFAYILSRGNKGDPLFKK